MIRSLIILLLIVGCGTEPEDACGVAGGDGTTCADCADTPNGGAVEDNCGVCDTDLSNDCVPDCADEWGGDAEFDECGVCNGEGAIYECGCAEIPDGDCDCNGNVEDECGVCWGDGSTCIECADCSDSECCDCDGNVYETIQIGDQLWMAENLKVTHYNDGSEIPNITSNNDWSVISGGAYCNYDNIQTNSDIYGRLYNLDAVIDNRGLCMEGWHVATDDDWKELELNLGMCEGISGNECSSTVSTELCCLDDVAWRGTDEGGKLKEIGYDHWFDPNLSATDEFAFTVLPAGSRNYSSGEFSSLGSMAIFWQPDGGNRWFSSSRSTIFRDPIQASEYGSSIRCLKD